MPHDVNGKEINAGDVVTIRFEVVQVHTGNDYCNVQLKSVLPMPPYTDSFIGLTAVNTRQTEKVV